MELEKVKRVLRYLLAVKGLTLVDVGNIIGVETDAYVDKMLRDEFVNNKIYAILDRLFDEYKGHEYKRVVKFVAGCLFCEAQKPISFFEKVFEITTNYEDVQCLVEKMLEIPDEYIVLTKNDSYLNKRNHYLDTLNNFISEMSNEELRLLLIQIRNNRGF